MDKKEKGEPMKKQHSGSQPFALPWSPLALQELGLQELEKDSSAQFPQELLPPVPAQTFLPELLLQAPVQAQALAQALVLLLALPAVLPSHCYQKHHE